MQRLVHVAHHMYEIPRKKSSLGRGAIYIGGDGLYSMVDELDGVDCHFGEVDDRKYSIMHVSPNYHIYYLSV